MSRRGKTKWTSSIYETERQREGGTVCAKSSMASIAMLAILDKRSDTGTRCENQVFSEAIRDAGPCVQLLEA
jgi:hypothetical protein